MEPRFSCFYSYLLYGICVKIFIVNRYTCISKSYTTTKNTIDRQYTERGKLWCQLLLVVLIKRIRLADLGFCTSCFCFPTKMLHLNAPFFPLKCSVSLKKSLKCSDNAHYTNGFLKLISKFTLTKTCKSCRTTTTCTSS